MQSPSVKPKFTLITDHRPLEKLGKVHTKTLNRLQEIMNAYDFDIMYKKGSEMPADYLSRNIVNAISWDSTQLAQAQNADPLLIIPLCLINQSFQLGILITFVNTFCFNYLCR